ncbi:MAG: hypothetical protein HYZ45_09910, partial [Burkholderiales bacterium]|nr:hypothetical protein [Burkholderiales bacterium]
MRTHFALLNPLVKFIALVTSAMLTISVGTALAADSHAPESAAATAKPAASKPSPTPTPS